MNAVIAIINKIPIVNAPLKAKNALKNIIIITIEIRSPVIVHAKIAKFIF